MHDMVDLDAEVLLAWVRDENEKLKLNNKYLSGQLEKLAAQLQARPGSEQVAAGRRGDA